MLTPVRSGRFKKDVKLAEKRGKDMGKLKAILLLLMEGRRRRRMSRPSVEERMERISRSPH